VLTSQQVSWNVEEKLPAVSTHHSLRGLSTVQSRITGERSTQSRSSTFFDAPISHFSSRVTRYTMIRSSLTASKLAQRAVSRRTGAVRTMAGKEILFGVEGRAAMLRGVDMLADAVQVRRFLQDRTVVERRHYFNRGGFNGRGISHCPPNVLPRFLVQIFGEMLCSA
jgi:hypothetical protein